MKLSNLLIGVSPTWLACSSSALSILLMSVSFYSRVSLYSQKIKKFTHKLSGLPLTVASSVHLLRCMRWALSGEHFSEGWALWGEHFFKGEHFRVSTFLKGEHFKVSTFWRVSTLRWALWWGDFKGVEHFLKRWALFWEVSTYRWALCQGVSTLRWALFGRWALRGEHYCTRWTVWGEHFFWEVNDIFALGWTLDATVVGGGFCPQVN